MVGQPPSEDQSVENLANFFSSYSLFITAMIEEDISGQPHKSQGEIRPGKRGFFSFYKSGSVVVTNEANDQTGR
jgi:hypothetical protein